MGIDVGNIEMYMGPRRLGAPDDLEEEIIGFIDFARETLDVAVQELESRRIAEALIGARQRGVRVRVVLEGDYLTEDDVVADPWSPGGGNEPNREIYAALLRAQIPLFTDLNPNLFHQKFIVRDSETSSKAAAVMTGSTNFTPTGVGTNLNHLVVIGGKRTSGVYQKEFDELWTGTFGEKRERHDPKPRTYDVSKVPVKVLFAPDHAPEMEIMKQMLKARDRIDFAVFTFSNSSGIDDTMIALQRGHIQVRGIIDRMMGNQRWAPTKALVKEGVELYLTRRGRGLRKLHHKLMVIDGEVIIAGSFNYTAPATVLNDENIVVIGDLDETDPVAKDRQRQLGQFALDEIDRIIERHGRPVH